MKSEATLPAKKGEDMRKTVLAIVIVAALLTLGAQGCCPLLNKASDEAGERLAEEIIEGGTGGQVDIEDGGSSVTIEGEDGSSITIDTSEGELAEDWPTDVPVYDGTIISSGSTISGGGALYNVIIETKDSGADVKAFYEKELKDEGWTISFSGESTVDGEKAYNVLAEKGDWSVVVAANESDGKTEIAVTAGK
jgi:hypothetical protein